MFIPSVQTVWWQGFASIYEVPFSCLTVGVGGHSCEISSMSCHRVARLIKVGRNCCCGVCVEWIVCCLSMLFKAFTKSAFSLTYILFLFLFVFVLFCRSANLAFSFVLFHTSRDVSLIRDPAKGTNQFCLRVAWTSAFKQFIFPYYSVTCWSVEQRNLFDCKKKMIYWLDLVVDRIIFRHHCYRDPMRLHYACARQRLTRRAVGWQ